jgi:hypothetical protein
MDSFVLKHIQTHYMKKCVIILLLTVFAFVSCNKVKEQIAENYLFSVMTTGQWKVGTYTEGGIVNIHQWDGYSFQFYSNYTVDAIRNGSLYSTGTWGTNFTDTSFFAQFPANVNDTLKKLNGSWKWNNSSPTYVNATHEVRGDKLHLIKQ